MKTTTIIATALTVAVIGATPTVATANVKDSHDGGDRIALNHNEILATTTLG